MSISNDRWEDFWVYLLDETKDCWTYDGADRISVEQLIRYLKHEYFDEFHDCLRPKRIYKGEET